MGSEYNYEYSSDAQVYGFSASASYDSLNVLPRATFAIDQLSSPPKIYTKDSLAYGFEVKNALVSISTNSANGVALYYSDNDSTFAYNSTDSVDLSRLTKITVYANDGVTNREYGFKINVHLQDPDTLIWQNISTNYISPAPAGAQKTIALNDKFITYYLSGGSVNAVSSPSADGKTWSPLSVSGLPSDVRLNSLTTIADHSVQIVYAATAGNKIFKSSGGASWDEVTTGYPVEAIYQKLPSSTVDSLVVAVRDGSGLKFAKTKDFSSFRLCGTVGEGFPVSNFSAIAMQDPESFTAKYIVVAGGNDTGGSQNNKTWVIQEKDGLVSALGQGGTNLNFAGNSLFEYDKKLYALTESGDKNVLMSSIYYGLTWSTVPGKQILPDNFPRRNDASVLTDDKNYIWIFGGTSGSAQIADVWRGRLNRLAAE